MRMVVYRKYGNATRTTKTYVTMLILIIPFGKLHGLWAPSSGVRDVLISVAYVFT